MLGKDNEGDVMGNQQSRHPKRGNPGLEFFEKTPLVGEPFEHLVAREFVKPQAYLRLWNFAAGPQRCWSY